MQLMKSHAYALEAQFKTTLQEPNYLLMNSKQCKMFVNIKMELMQSVSMCLSSENNFKLFVYI